jgi:hypothetical protein
MMDTDGTKPLESSATAEEWRARGRVHLAKFSTSGTAAAQLPAAEPLQDDRLTFVTTTESKARQPGAIFKPAFGWETLNLNVDPA